MRSIRNVTFDFLGYCFRPRLVKNTRNRQLFCGFNPAASPAALKDIRSTIKSLKIRRQTQFTLEEIVRRLNPLPAGMDRVLRTVYAFGVGAYLPARQLDAAALGATEI